MTQPTLLVHGGAGTLSPDRLTPAKRQSVLLGLKTALLAGHCLLQQGASALDAVEAAVTALEDDPNFNAGRGAVFTAAGTHEMDAAIMDGATQRVGAVAGILGPRNPVQAARLVLERSPHVLLAGQGALDFLCAHHLPTAEPAYFGTEDRRAALDAVLSTENDPTRNDDFNRHGTVGAVALDRAGNLAAATSTGGMTGKFPGRLGDTPVPGAGTWADQTCAVSATGHGESFIRAGAAHELSARLRHANQDLQTAADAVLAAVAALGGTGGLIALDRNGNIALPFNTRGMYRGQITGDTGPLVAIYDEPLTP
ncbi:MAG: isoaspartyl peptidase/L-asparaginase [Acetobacteraceae bacterium]